MSARWQRKGKAQESLLFVVTVIMSQKEPTTDTSACTLTLEHKSERWVFNQRTAAVITTSI